MAKADPETGTDLVRGDHVESHGDYALARLQCAELLEEMCESKLNALDLLSRLEAALWAACLLDQPDAEAARIAFGVGLAEFTARPGTKANVRRTRPQ